MLSKYARKKMLESVARSFTADQLEVLNQNVEFRQLCQTEIKLNVLIEAGHRIAPKNPNPRKPGFNNPIAVPDLVTSK